MYLLSLGEDLYFYLKEHTQLLQFSIIESQNNGDDAIITRQIIMTFMINWIIAHPYKWIKCPYTYCSV